MTTPSGQPRDSARPGLYNAPGSVYDNDPRVRADGSGGYELTDPAETRSVRYDPNTGWGLYTDDGERVSGGHPSADSLLHGLLGTPHTRPGAEHTSQRGNQANTGNTNSTNNNTPTNDSSTDGQGVAVPEAPHPVVAVGDDRPASDGTASTDAASTSNPNVGAYAGAGETVTVAGAVGSRRRTGGRRSGTDAASTSRPGDNDGATNIGAIVGSGGQVNAGGDIAGQKTANHQASVTSREATDDGSDGW